MTIGIEAERANNPQKTGVEHYAKQLLLHLAAEDSKNQYRLYLRTEPEDWLKELPANFHLKVLPFPIFWTQLRLSLELLLHPVDVLLIPASALPLWHPRRSVVTIHDLAWKFFPETFTWFNRNFLEFSTRYAVRRAAAVIAVSESTRRDLIKFYGVRPEKITVVHHGFDRPAADEYPAASRLRDLLPGHYVLFLSTLQPRKNLEGLVKAFAELRAQQPEFAGYKLVVAGRPGWKARPILALIERHRDFVVYLNYVPDTERFLLLKRAAALVVPSFYEGFGMPILEAFASGVPVAAANNSSLPEVAGEAAVYFDPQKTEEIKHSLKILLTDRALAQDLAGKGARRLQYFSWEKCARETLAVLNKA
ncbi:MAG TPA: glycosyltransferase family 1 protein [Patescibacteria group bacterium]|nr:glycosyltransferase family 1 protein [Patescibacteria group bacterium]